MIAEGPAEIVAMAEVPADVRAAVTGDWVSQWICLAAERLRRMVKGIARPYHPWGLAGSWLTSPRR